MPAVLRQREHAPTQFAKETGRSEDCPQTSWSTAEVVYDKHGKPFDGEAAVRQGIVNYYQNGDGRDNE
jgi:hypothetical protein